MKYFLLAVISFLILTPLDAQSDQEPQELELKSFIIFNKYYKGGERINKKEFSNYLRVKDDFYYPYKMGKTVGDVGVVFVVLSGTVAFLDIRYRNRLKAFGQQSDDPLQNEYLTCAYLGGGLGVAMFLVGRSIMKREVSQYNQLKVTSLDFKVNQDGLGLVYSF